MRHAYDATVHRNYIPLPVRARCGLSTAVTPIQSSAQIQPVVGQWRIAGSWSFRWDFERATKFTCKMRWLNFQNAHSLSSGARADCRYLGGGAFEFFLLIDIMPSEMSLLMAGFSWEIVAAREEAPSHTETGKKEEKPRCNDGLRLQIFGHRYFMIAAAGKCSHSHWRAINYRRGFVSRIITPLEP